MGRGRPEPTARAHPAPPRPWTVVVAGTLSLDDLTTPSGRALEEPGGSAAYSALAVAPLAPVRVVAAVGADGARARAVLDGPGIDGTDVVVRPGSTYRWQARHDPSTGGVADERQQLGVYAGWIPHLSPASRAAPVCLVGSMAPACQLAVLAQTTARLVVVDTMEDFIATEPALVRRCLAAADVICLNLRELRRLGGPATEATARSLLGIGRTRAVVVKGGADGVRLLTAQGDLELPAAPVGVVTDPTGAGDALAGGFCGALALRGTVALDAYPDALAVGLRAAARAVSAFGLRGLVAPAAARPAGG